MSILVVGSTGLLGSTLCPILVARGADVVRHGNLRQADLTLDLLDRAATFKALSKLRPARIINLAALSNVDECEANPHSAYLLNVHIVENLAAWIKTNRDTHLVHVSTDQVYDDAGPHAEDDVRLRHVYALTKYAGEIVAAGVGGIVLRSNFFGPSRLRGRMSFSDWLVSAMREGRPTKVFTDVLFSPLSMTTLGEMIAVSITRPIAGIFNLGSHEGLSKADFAFELASVLGISPLPLTRALSSEVSLRAYRPKDMRMNSSRFERTFDARLPLLVDEIRSLR